MLISESVCILWVLVVIIYNLGLCNIVLLTFLVVTFTDQYQFSRRTLSLVRSVVEAISFVGLLLMICNVSAFEID